MVRKNYSQMKIIEGANLSNNKIPEDAEITKALAAGLPSENKKLVLHISYDSISKGISEMRKQIAKEKKEEIKKAILAFDSLIKEIFENWDAESKVPDYDDLEPLVAEFMELDKQFPYGMGSTVDKARTRIIKALQKRVLVANKMTKTKNMGVLVDRYKDKAEIFFQTEYEEILNLATELEKLFEGQETYLFDVLLGDRRLLNINNLTADYGFNLSDMIESQDPEHNKRWAYVKVSLITLVDQYKIIQPFIENFKKTNWQKILEINKIIAQPTLEKVSRCRLSLLNLLERDDLIVPIRILLQQKLDIIQRLEEKQARLKSEQAQS